ncbi:hypothetical protein S40285_06765 [Stachybotrys chlorohalonatus IBT 40285]|uniref:SET domain-containing protein n=1 Tax=Stachybotrys chlorohalonatus (strain IBT 40285) TaxID=1283841 RepID=A0A084QJV1_STAC4|nr:hypothetical protein S40285_06765 [Stachybotrys chlorohalonata IBT 40285]
MSGQDFDQRTENFLTWFKSLPGATFSDSIQIQDLRGRGAGRGIVAVKDIEPDTTLFTIPRLGIINAETSNLSKELPSIFSQGDDGVDIDEESENSSLDSWSSLILIMIYEHLRGPASPWQPYLSVLPTEFETPMFWSERELDELQASATRSKIGKASAEEMFRTQLLPIIRGNPGVFLLSPTLTDEDLVNMAHRMGSTIMAYAFDLENDDDKEDDASDGWVEDRDGKSMMGMVPMADILNADAEFNAHVNHEEETLTVTALRPIKAGEEILNYYGPHPNSELLRRYGYVTSKHTRYDVVEIPWEIVENALAQHLGLSKDALNKVRAKLDDDEFEDVFVLERESGEPSSDGTFSTPAVLIGMPEDLQRQLKSFLKVVSKLEPNSVPDKRKRDEIHHAILAQTIQTLQARYPTGITEDELLLRADGLPPRRRSAIVVRLGEKRLLDEARNMLSSSSDMDITPDDAGPSKRTKTSV